MSDSRSLKIAVVVATLGRPAEVGDLLETLGRQTVPPDTIVLSVTKSEDLPSQLPEGAIVITGSKGLPAQRNRGMKPALEAGADIIVFFDDDYILTVTALEDMRALFDREKRMVGLTGTVLADGIKGPGLQLAEAQAFIAEYEARPQAPLVARPTYGLYGCNMAFRASAIEGRRFDEALPLYAWQEDTDFSRQMSVAGQLLKTNGFAGVHRGVKSARTSGFQFGWSQVVNPAYLVKKGTMAPIYGLRRIVKNMIANHVHALWPETWVDRRGRLRGNYAGLAYVLSGRCNPSDLPSNAPPKT